MITIKYISKLWLKVFVLLAFITLGYWYVLALLSYPWPTVVYTLVAIVLGALLLDWFFAK